MLSSKQTDRKSKKGKFIKLIKNSDTEDEDSEHELSYYIKDRVKLMKEVLKIIKPKKIKSMAPDCIKKLEMEEINSMLLEELLGISNKRLKYIFQGKHLEVDSSSSEEEEKPIDIISLDDISDDEFVIEIDSDHNSTGRKGRKHKQTKVKEEPKKKKIKKEKLEKESTRSKEIAKEKEKTGEENLMTVLELLELQARARAIRSQLALENSKKAETEKDKTIVIEETQNEDEEDAVIIESPKNVEIIITSDDSENEEKHIVSDRQINKSITGDVNKPQSIQKVDFLSSSAELLENENTHSGKNNESHNQLKESVSYVRIPLPNEDVITNVKSVENKHIEDNVNVHDESSETTNYELQNERQHISGVAHESVQSETDDGLHPIVETDTEDKRKEEMKIDNSPSNSDKCTNQIVISPCLENNESNTSDNNDTVNKSKEKRLRNFKNKLKSYKNEIEPEGKIRIVENVVIKLGNVEKGKEQHASADDGDGIIINVDQDEIDCIICD